MLNLLMRILAVIAVMIGIVLLIGSLLPRDFEVSCEIVIDASPEEIFPHINRLRLWSEWSPWNQHEITSLTVQYSGEDEGVGAIQNWSEPRGEGKLWITASELNKHIEYKSVFAKFPEMQCRLTLTKVDAGTQVTWSSIGALPKGPFYGWFGMSFSNAMQNEYNKSLKQLKTVVERKIKNSKRPASKTDPVRPNESPSDPKSEPSSNANG